MPVCNIASFRASKSFSLTILVFMHYDYTYAYEYVKPGNDGLRGEMIRAREKN